MDPNGTSALGISVLGSIGLGESLRGRDAAATGAAAGSIFGNLLFWEQMGLTIVGGGALLNNACGDDLREWVLAQIGLRASASSASGVTANQIAGQMSSTEFQTHGDPSRWKFKQEKPGSGAPGNTPGDVKYYEIWINEFGRRIEVHYFRDAARMVKEWTIKIKEWSP